MFMWARQVCVVLVRASHSLVLVRKKRRTANLNHFVRDACVSGYVYRRVYIVYSRRECVGMSGYFCVHNVLQEGLNTHACLKRASGESDRERENDGDQRQRSFVVGGSSVGKRRAAFA